MTTLTTLPTQTPPPEIDRRWLDRELDRVKTKVFLGRTAAFLAHVMCSMDFQWSDKIPTACTNGLQVLWNPRWFKLLPERTRHTVLIHELWHVAKLHQLRIGDRNPEVWNMACDYNINGEMDNERENGHPFYSFEGSFPEEMFPRDPLTGELPKPCLDHQYDGMTPEEIYDSLMKLPPPKLQNMLRGFCTDLASPKDEPGDSPVNPHTLINTVVSATHAAKLAGAAGSIPGEVEATLRRFLKPKLPWKKLIWNFFNSLVKGGYTWKRPNRRYTDMYLPSRFKEKSALDHLVYFFDVSGSVTDGQETIFGSEFKHVLEYFKPKKITAVQFDTIIQKQDEYKAGDKFEKMDIIGRGGTSLVCVRDYIIEHKPTAVVIFSDLYCEPMEKLPAGMNIPIIWVCIDNKEATVNEGKLIHIKE